MVYDQQNIFAKILRNEIPCNKVYEDQYALAFHDLNPSAPVHVLFIPKGEFISFSHFIDTANHNFIASFFTSVRRVIEILEIENSGYRIISNCGSDGMQTVYHFHIHILGKKRLGALVSGDNFHA
ncbi:MAG: HIT domain-containing protein [Candidatus Midichloria sp.]|nr:MAG: HIT domain-containing protein [Candidatus Midichloria sp.]